MVVLERLGEYGSNSLSYFESGFLRNVTETEILAECDDSFVCGFDAREDRHQSGFAGAVWSNEPDALALRDYD